MIFSTCVLLICLCRRNLQPLKCCSFLGTWSCTILKLPCGDPVLYGGSREMMWWGSASAHILNSDVSQHCAWVIDGCGHCESLLYSSVLHQDNTVFFSHWSHTHTYHSILRVSELVGPHLLSFMWLSVRVLQHVQQHILEGSEGVCS